MISVGPAVLIAPARRLSWGGASPARRGSGRRRVAVKLTPKE